MAQKKFYVVWQGVKPGIYSSWEECKAQVSGFENARYKSFPSMEEAKKAFGENPWKHMSPKKVKKNGCTGINRNNHQGEPCSRCGLQW